MTPRERVLSALNHREPDRVPVDLSGHRSSGIAAIAYAKLRKHLGLKEKPLRVYDPIQQLAIVDSEVLDLFGIDTLELGRASGCVRKTGPTGSCLTARPARCPPGPGRNAVATPGSSARRLVGLSLACRMARSTSTSVIGRTPMNTGRAAWSKRWTRSCGRPFASPPGPLVAGPDGRSRFAEGAKILRSQTDRAIIGLFGGNLLETGQFFYGMGNFLTLLASDPRQVHDFLDRLVETHIANLEAFLGAVGPYIDIVLFGDDLGMQTGPQMSPRMYREFFKPRHALMWKRAKELAPVKVMLHCCGGVRELLRDLIEAGLDAINPVQISCKGMIPAELKKEFGKDLTFWGGGCETQLVLSQATAETVRTHVRDQVRLLSPGGGFVFQQVHNILANVPPENVVAMYEGVRAAA